MGNTLIDMTGKTFGYLTVLNKAPSRVSPSGNHVTRWHCKCICGTERDVDAYALRSGNTTSCGCMNKKPIKDISGKRYGMLVVRQLDRKENHATYWLCDCDCGNQTVVSKGNLINGNTKSCGCLTSAGEAEIQREFNVLNIEYIHEASFDSLRSDSGSLLQFDFAVTAKETIIFLLEYQGAQHFQSWNKYGKYQREVSDIKKKEWCKMNGIPLHEIRYDEDLKSRLYEILSFHRLIPCQASKEEGVTTIQ